jgi:hypothetical protein
MVIQANIIRAVLAYFYGKHSTKEHILYNTLQKMPELKLSRPLHASNDDTQCFDLVPCVCTFTVHLHTKFHTSVSSVL